MDYKTLFKQMLDKYNVSSPSQIPEDKRDDFFLELDKMWNSADEKGQDGPQLAGLKIGQTITLADAKYMNDLRAISSKLSQVWQSELEKLVKKHNLKDSSMNQIEDELMGLLHSKLGMD